MEGYDSMQLVGGFETLLSYATSKNFDSSHDRLNNLSANKCDAVRVDSTSGELKLWLQQKRWGITSRVKFTQGGIRIFSLPFKTPPFPTPLPLFRSPTIY